jgi:hypothetical protein
MMSMRDQMELARTHLLNPTAVGGVDRKDILIIFYC